MKNSKLKSIVSFLLVMTMALLMFVPASAENTQSAGTGLWGRYYNGTSFDTLIGARQDSTVDFVWSVGASPMAGIGAEHYSIIWSGRVKADYTGIHTFSTNTDDGVRLYIDGNVVINDGGPHGAETRTGTYEMAAGEFYDIAIEYYNGLGGGTMQLYWEHTGLSKCIIPESSLYPPEFAAEVGMKYTENSEVIYAYMNSLSDEILTLHVEKFDGKGELVDTFEKARPDSAALYWEIENLLEENKDYTYTAWVKNAAGEKVSDTVSARYGEDFAITVDPAAKTGEVSPLLYGVCMEDVNHELYGGIWSQMIFGESFEEDPTVPFASGFTSAGGKWYTKDEDGSKLICIDRTDNGPKLIIDDSSCTSGTFSADVYVSGEGAGFIIKTSDAKPGADSFNGYEISLFNNNLRIGRHQFNYALISDTPCDAPINTWHNLKVVTTETSIEVFVDGVRCAEYNDSNLIKSGQFGLRSWNATAYYKNLKMSLDGGAETDIVVPEVGVANETAGMWEAVIADGVNASTRIVTENAYSGKQSQRITFTSGTGTASVNNMGLNRKGMNFVKDGDYNGYFYAKSDAAAEAYVAFESADGSVTYCSADVEISGSGWNKYSFTLTPEADDSAGRFSIGLKSAGTLDIGYVFLEPGEWGLYKGLPVRRDVGEALENQGLSVMRFGGCMANSSGFKWKSMLGEPETRPNYNGWWYPYSSLGFGIIEFLDLCEALGIVAVPDFNSYESSQDMVDFITFATGTDSSNEWVMKRIEMGHPEPYDLPFIQIGNEERIDAAFADRFNAIANAVWAVDDNITLIAGDFGYGTVITDPYNFTGASSGITTFANHKTMLDNATEKNRRIWFDIHFWSENGSQPYSDFIVGISMYNALKEICPDADFALPVFELNANNHDFERGLCNALAINTAERLSEIFPIICSANALQVDGHNDNGWNQGLLFMDNDSAWYQPAAYMDRMFKDAYLPNTLGFTSEKSVNNPDFDVTVTGSDDGETVCVKVLNRTGAPKGLTVCIPDFAGYETDIGITAYEDELKSANTSAEPQVSKPGDTVTLTRSFESGGITVSTAAYSFTVVTFTKGEKTPDILMGDLDKNGSINVSDVVALRQAIMNYSADEYQKKAGDLDGNGTLNVADVVALRSLIMNME